VILFCGDNADQYDFLWSVLEHEGFLSNRKNDKGGLTYRGITWKLYQAYCKRKHIPVTKKDLKKLSNERVKDVYILMFIKPLKIMQLENDWLREAFFSAGMNHGGGNAVKMVQRVISELKVDGRIGPKTISAMNEQDVNTLVNALVIERCIFVAKYVKGRANKGDLSQLSNLVGWLTRYTRFIKPNLFHLS